MIKMTSKKKYKLIKASGIVVNIIIIFLATSLGVVLKLDALWKDIPLNGITSFYQWITIVTYRLIIYFVPSLILSLFVFDKRFKYISRLKIWLNWTLGIYLFSSAFISVFEIDSILKISIFDSLDSIVLLTGYMFTLLTKDKVEFDSTGAIINPKEINQN